MKSITLPIRFAVALTTSLIAYFLILSLFNLHTNPFFSLFNGVITGFAIYEAIRYRRIELGENYNYSTGFSAGIVTGFLATILFTIFMTVYAAEINPGFIPMLLEEFSSSFDISIGVYAFVVFLMGLATSVVLTLAFMQLYKNPIQE
ncbi:MAG: DUF4199 family protein [Bacteroidota bacterium]